jgi:hypothetical protein
MMKFLTMDNWIMVNIYTTKQTMVKLTIIIQHDEIDHG